MFLFKYTKTLLVYMIVLLLAVLFFLPSNHEAAVAPTPTVKLGGFQQVSDIKQLDPSFGSASLLEWRPYHGELAVSYEQDNTIKIYDLSGNVKSTINVPTTVGNIAAIIWSPDGRLLAARITYPDNYIDIWDMSGNKIGEPLKINGVGQGQSLSWSPNSRNLLATGTFEDHPDQWILTIWDAKSGQKLKDFQDSAENISRAVWSPIGNKIATFGHKGTASMIEIRDASTMAVQAELPNQNNLTPLDKISWNSDGSQLAGADCDTVSGRCYLWLWDVQNNRMNNVFLRVQTGSTEIVGTFTAISLNPNRRITLLAINNSASADYVWDTESGAVISSLDGQSDWISSLSWSSDGFFLATGSTDGTIRIWQYKVAVS